MPSDSLLCGRWVLKCKRAQYLKVTSSRKTENFPVDALVQHLQTFICAHTSVSGECRCLVALSLALIVSIDCVFIFLEFVSFHTPLFDTFFPFFCFHICAVTGTCLFTYGLKLGELCSRDADCESGLVCDVSATSGASVCRAPMAVAKQYAEDCLTSSDCDISRYVLVYDDWVQKYLTKSKFSELFTVDCAASYNVVIVNYPARYAIQCNPFPLISRSKKHESIRAKNIKLIQYPVFYLRPSLSRRFALISEIHWHASELLQLIR